MNSNDRAIVGLVTIAHASVHTYELSVPILMGVWLTQFDVSYAVLGLAVSIGYALFGLGALPGGMLADVLGSQRLIFACFLGMGGSFLLLALAPGRIAPPVPVITVALVLWGIAASVYHPSGLSLISTGVSERGSAFAYHGIAGNFGIAFGPLATTLLLLFFDWRTVAILLAVPAAVGAALALRIDVDEQAAVEVTDGGVDDEADDHDENPAVDDGRDGGGDSKADAVTSLPEFIAGSKALFASTFLLVFLVVMCSGLYYRGVLTFLPVILDGFPGFEPVAFAGKELKPSRYAYVGLLAIGMAGQFVGGKLTDRIDTAKGIAGAFAVLAVLAVAFVPVANAGLLPFVVVGTLLGFFLFLVQPMYQATVAELTPAGTRGLSYGYTYLGVFGVGALGGTVAGAVLQYGSPFALFLVLAAIAGFASVGGGVLVVRR